MNLEWTESANAIVAQLVDLYVPNVIYPWLKYEIVGSVILKESVMCESTDPASQAMNTSIFLFSNQDVYSAVIIVHFPRI